jgi:hypothetical protein
MGMGRVVSTGDGEKVTIFFLRGGKRIFFGSSAAFEQVDAHDPILEISGSTNWDHGEHAARIVQKYGRRLLPDLYQHFNPLPYELAQQMEPELARQLRAGGLAVWQN